jgi:hypothetical protein
MCLEPVVKNVIFTQQASVVTIHLRNVRDILELMHSLERASRKSVNDSLRCHMVLDDAQATHDVAVANTRRRFGSPTFQSSSFDEPHDARITRPLGF